SLSGSKSFTTESGSTALWVINPLWTLKRNSTKTKPMPHAYTHCPPNRGKAKRKEIDMKNHIVIAKLSRLLCLTLPLLGAQAALAFYDPSVGRWINRDPIVEAGGINLYQFVHNAPANQIYPFGNMVAYCLPLADSKVVEIDGGYLNKGWTFLICT